MSENLNSLHSKAAEPSAMIKKPRMGWLDALRGFTMLLVVTNHVALKSFGMQIRWSAALQFFLLFRMPLFFFISGFLAYKASRIWNGQTLRELSLKKFKVQIIPTVVFFLLYLAMIPSDPFAKSFSDAIASSMKAGYWFTLVLLYMLLTNYVFSYVESKLRLSWMAITGLFIISLGFFETCYLPRYFSWGLGHKGPQNEFLNYTSLVEMMRYFPFFLYGNIVHRYWDKAQKLMDSSWFFPVITVLANLIKGSKIFTQKALWTLSSSGSVDHFFSRRTLDIYLLHYFFLPKMTAVGAYFQTNRHNFILDTTASLAIALVVVGFCVITSQLLRVSPFFKKYLFGR